MSGGRERESARGKLRDWRRIVRKQEASGVSVSAFCQVQGLANSTSYFWRRQRRWRAAGRSDSVSSRNTRTAP